MQLGLSESLSTLVARRFTAAKEGGHLVFSSTQLANIHASGIPVRSLLPPYSKTMDFRIVINPCKKEQSIINIL